MANMTIKMVPVEWLEAHPDNPRKDLGDLTELAESIDEAALMDGSHALYQGGKK